MKGRILMNTIEPLSRGHTGALLLSMICAAVVTLFLGGCAEAPYATATAYGPPGYHHYYSYPNYARTSYYFGLGDYGFAPAYTYGYGPGYGGYGAATVSTGVRYHGPSYWTTWY